MRGRQMEQHRLWGIVLAGGEGERLRGFVRTFLGSDAPKQFCAFLGRRTMVEHTLRRAETLIPRHRLLLVAAAHHRRHLFASLAERPPGTVLLQPAGRDTGPGVLLPLLHVLHRDPGALVAILPSDHFVRPGRRFMGAVQAAAEYVARTGSDSVVLLGVEPTDPETDYGWLGPGPSADAAGWAPLRSVSGFVEKPGDDQAAALMAEGWLWNTMVLVARADALWKLVRDTAPELAAYFSMVRRAIGTLWESEILNDVYRMLPPVNFSRAVLARCPERLLVLPIRNVLWSDWGRGERVIETLTRIGIPENVLARAGVVAG